MRKRVIAQLVLSVALIGATLPLFQNCGPRMRTAPPEAVFATQEQLEDDLVYALKAAGPGADTICGAIESYSCETQEFGPDVADGIFEGRHCSDAGCVDVLSLSFNTAKQIAACEDDGCSPERIAQEYDYLQVRCMNKALPMAGTLPLVAAGDDLDSALAAAQARCRELAGLQ